MNRIKKYLYIALGFIALGLGIIGIILPVLPTTPFLLVTSYCFAKGSDRFHNWFINTKVYKKHLESFVKERAMTLKEKVVLLSFVNFMLAFPLILIDVLAMRITIIILIIIKLYYFTFKVRTITPEEKKAILVIYKKKVGISCNGKNSIDVFLLIISNLSCIKII